MPYLQYFSHVTAELLWETHVHFQFSMKSDFRVYCFQSTIYT